MSFTLGLLSCGEDADKLTVAEKQLIDTLYFRELNKIRPLLDSICEAQEDSLVKVTADSLVKAREDEIDRIMNRQ